MSWPEDTSVSHVDGTSRGANDEELFVFGYGCKIFRDDEKAEWIDEGKHLIPWMGDSELLIDRYDGRGALMDLKFYEPREDRDTNEELDPDEAYIEKLCDEERYRELNEDEDYETSYQEAEFKRLQMAVNEMSGGGDGTNNINNSNNSSSTSRGGDKEYGSVGYTYSDNVIPVGPVPKQIKNELPYTPPPDLAIPPEILHPLTMKSHAIIEKTAKFIASHGTQMEIILKTKQAKNPQFDFLSHNDPLNPYYKFLVYAIKSNMYKPPDVYHDDSSNESGGSDNEENSSDEEDGGYLHPSLIKKTSDLNKFMPKVNLKPSSDCAYSMLVSKIKEASSDNNTKSFPQDQQQLQQQQQYQQPNQQGLTLEINPNYSTYYNNTGYPTITTQPVQQHINLMPNPQEQLIIEKMANYVIKNGPEFEVMAYQKCDPRFAFLETTHQHHWYYLQCKEKASTEVKAVVASKSFVRYNENSTDTNTLQPQSNVPSTQYSSVSASTQAIVNTSSSSPPPPQSDESQSSSKNYHASVIHKPRTTKDILQTTKVKNEKEKLIKFSSNLSNFATVLKQKEEEEEELEVIKSLDNIDNDNNILSKKDDGSNGVKDKVDEDEVRRLKEERRKKAALFLQSLKLKKSQSLVQSNITSTSTTSVAPTLTTTTIPLDDDVPSDVESIPSPTVVFKEQVQIPKKSPSEAPPPNDLESDVTIIHQQKNELTIVKDLVYDRLKSTEDLTKSDKSNLNDKDKKDRRYTNSRNRSSRRSRSPRPSRRSRSSSGISDSRSSSKSSSSSSYSHKRKKSKRKHSKKSHKKRDRSRSKKSKKRRH